MKFNLKQKSLLAASGELGPLAHKRLLQELAENPELAAEYEAAQRSFAVLGVLPIPEPSAAERQAIPAQIKAALRAAIAAREKRANRWHLPAGWAKRVGGAACVGLVLSIASSANALRQQNDRRQAQVAQIYSLMASAQQGELADAAEADAGQDADGSDKSWLSYMQDAEFVVPGQDLNAVHASDPSAPPGSF